MPAGESWTKFFPPAAGIAVLVFALAISFWIDADNVEQGGAIDLRNRITGARLMSDGIDPYTYKWTRADPEIYCDVYNNPNMPVSKTTSTPALLALTLPWATLPYRNGQWLWFVAQWALLLGAGGLWWHTFRDQRARLILGAVFFVFTLGAGWRLHAERGQSYVVLTFLLALWLAGTLRAGRGWSFAGGFAAGWLAVARPPCLLLLPVLAWKRRDQIPGMAAGLAVGIVLPILFLRAIWGDYFAGMQQQASSYLNAIEPAPGQHAYPATIENMSTLLMGNYVPISYADASVFALLRGLGAASTSASGIFFAGVVPFAAWSIWALRRNDLPRLLIGLAAWMFLLDFFLPAYRNSYNDILALDFLALGLLFAPRYWIPLVPAALALVTGVWIYITSPDIPWQINLPALLFALSAVLYLFVPLRLVLDTAAASRQNVPC